MAALGRLGVQCAIGNGSKAGQRPSAETNSLTNRQPGWETLTKKIINRYSWGIRSPCDPEGVMWPHASQQHEEQLPATATGFWFF